MAELDEALIDRDAAWARRFGNATQSLPQRARHLQAIKEGEELRGRREATARESLLSRDKGARDLMFGRERLADADERLSLDERRLSLAEKNAEFSEGLRLSEMDIREAKAAREAAQATMAAKNALRIEQQTTGAIEEMDALMESAVPGSEQFAAGAAALMAKYPLMDRQMRTSLMGSAKILDEDESLETVLASAPPGTKPLITRSNKGFSVRFQADAAPKKEDPDQIFTQFRQAELDRANLFQPDGKLKPGVDAGTVEIFTTRRDALRDRIKGAAAPVDAPSATPSPVPSEAMPRVSTPTSGQASQVFKDEAEALAAGAKRGDIIVLVNPATGKPARARLE